MTITAQRIFQVFLFLAIVCSTFWRSVSPVSAYTFRRDIATKVEVISVSEVKVTQTHRLSWDNSTYFFPASKNSFYAYVFPAFTEQASLLKSGIRDIHVSGGSSESKDVPYTTSSSEGALQIKAPYYANLEYGNDLEYTVTYKTSLYVLSEGGLLEVNYPGLSTDFKAKIAHKDEGYDEITSYTLKVVTPDKYGKISSTSPTALLQKSDKGVTTTTFGTGALTGNSVHITAGDTRIVRFTLSGKTYATNSQTPDFAQGILSNFIEVALPTSREGTEFSGQTVYFSKIEPFPISIKTDDDGNIIAKIPVSATKVGQITIEGYALLRNIRLPDTVKSELKSAIPDTMKGYFAAESRYWQVNDPVIVENASKESVISGNIYEQLRKTLRFVSQQLHYANVDNEASLVRLGAVEALKQKVGVCMEYSDLLLTLLRAQGIPARTVFGDGVGSRVDRTLKGIGHQWVGVWFPGYGWVPVDPTWSDNNQEYIGQDFNHFTWYVASKSVNEPSGFNCLSWDSTSPCHEALQIETVPVDKLPAINSLMTLADVQQKVTEKEQSGNVVTDVLQKGGSYLGNSQLGRILLSRQGMLILFALALYSILVTATSVITKRLRKIRQTKFPPK